MIFAALVMTALTTREPCANKTRITSLWTILTAIGLYLFAGYEAAGAPDIMTYRVALGFEHQTGTAYALTLIALLASQAIINLRLKHTVALYLLHFLISLAVIITTQTRAAILVYPILSVGLFLMYYRHNRTMLLRALLGFVILVGVAAIPLKPIIESRYQNFWSICTLIIKTIVILLLVRDWRCNGQVLNLGKVITGGSHLNNAEQKFSDLPCKILPYKGT
jgi:O-antigen ligase